LQKATSRQNSCKAWGGKDLQCQPHSWEMRDIGAALPRKAKKPGSGTKVVRTNVKDVNVQLARSSLSETPMADLLQVVEDWWGRSTYSIPRCIGKHRVTQARTHTHIYIYTYTYTNICLYIYIYIFFNIRIYRDTRRVTMRVFVNMHVWMHVCVHRYAHAYSFAYSVIHILIFE